MLDQEKKIVRNIVEEHWNKKNAGIASDLFTANCVIHTPDGDLKGIEGAKQLLASYSKAFPDFKMTVNDLIGEGDVV